MIRVDRGRVSTPAVLIGDRSKGPKEAARALKSLEKWSAMGKNPAEWTFAYAAYREPEVKSALARLFHDKCAYCETRYSASQPMDVEHWRPKAQIEDPSGPIRPAYHWLAASWDNLLPSCIDCNRRRKQIDVLAGRVHAIGKHDQFPLDADSVRAAWPEDLDQEVPPLLDPCSDDPEQFLECTEDGLIIPQTVDGLPYRRATASIHVYALNRNGLVFERKQLIRRIRLRVARIGQLARLLDDPRVSGPVALLLDEVLADDLKELARMRRADQPYALLARRLIDRWMGEFTEHGGISLALDNRAQPGRAE